VNIQVDVFCIVTSCSVVIRYQFFRGPCWRWRQHGSPKRWYRTMSQSRRPRVEISPRWKPHIFTQ